ncbi:MAG: hypothetical protein H6825_11815 [Planctomycetes bacterium]|nr:hypothetical protein [Planctomycetota bacterium]
MTRLDVRGLSIACGLLWGGCMLVTSLTATALGTTAGGYYGKDFLLAMASVYPGYTGTPGMLNSFVGAGYGLLDGMLGGALLAWLANRFSRTAAPN